MGFIEGLWLELEHVSLRNNEDLNRVVNLAPSTTIEPCLFEVVWKLKILGYSERTLKGYSKRLRMLTCASIKEGTIFLFSQFSPLSEKMQRAQAYKKRQCCKD
jgi:hypothetical protein